MTKLILSAGVALLAAAALLSFGVRAFDTQAATRTVDVGDLFFRDSVSTNSTSTITVGDTVQWNWIGAAPHSVTATDASFDEPAGSFKASGTFSFTFNTVGSYTYACRVHPQMTGTIVVQAGAAPTNTPEPNDTPTRTRTPEPDDTPQATATLAGNPTPIPAITVTPAVIAPAPATPSASGGAAPAVIAPRTGSGDGVGPGTSALSMLTIAMAVAGGLAVAGAMIGRRGRR